MSEPFSQDSLPAPNTSQVPDDPEGRSASGRGMGGQEIDLQLKPERGECAALEIGCVSFPARARGQDHINEDYVGVMLGDLAERAARGSVIALADGVSGSKGGRVAAELSVRTFIDAYYGLADTLQPGVAAARALEAIHGWLHQIGRVDPALKQMSASFAALIVRRATAYLVAAGDVRLYLLRDGQLAQLGDDDVVPVAFGSYVAHAVGMLPTLVTRIETLELREGDRLLMCSDGLYRRVPMRELQTVLAARGGALETARRLNALAMTRGSQDDVTSAVLDVGGLPLLDVGYLERVVGTLPIPAVPDAGEVVDGYLLKSVLSDGFYSRIFAGYDLADPNTPLALKFPKPRVEQDENVRQSIVRERWLAGKISDDGVLAPMPIDADRQTRLYVVMPLGSGVTLEKLLAAPQPMALPRALKIAQQLGHSIDVLNRRNIFHRDIKPENVLVMWGDSTRLLDLGFGYMPGMQLPGPDAAPGSPAYMAPELMKGAQGDARSEVFAFGVTLYRLFSGGKLPYGFNGRVPLYQYRQDAPLWLDLVLEKALQSDPARRYQDVLEVCADLERFSSGRDAMAPIRRKPLLESDPVLFWQVVVVLLLALLLWSLMRH
ncbi:bifunctional protein-serine/threonine kinase/phosphatase [Paraburkholderia nemoris]|uniref:bifunctional protein-serine/threonine kinase/phosphatase n=1 Tax=Paraburkholderia nemoris TaxID=2793076 RepID=UPI00190D9ED6|nr:MULTISPECIES: bifunctional protein-serine/threonine kinase/phosphatase [Paraburkholderia]MBK3783727.1 bifunctional protein-serine/threonine kinase/phosphatase [Paraburkholderia aspalathi]CAE6730917.1 Serine/threonine-protein kinase PknD [Paraburkholderia nemoris]CAE6744538.1 Serine/threonine-protein kinase PknD [Paraburkholderia nemoris]